MASGENSSSSKSSSKIPRYVKTTLPFASSEYKKTLKEVKEKRICIEGKLGELKLLKKDFKVYDRTSVAAVSPEVEGQDDNLGHEVETPLPLASETVSSLSSGQAVRTVIGTPGGTKRKVTVTHRAFRDRLEEVLKQKIIRSPGEELPVENLINNISDKIPGAKIESRSTLLRTITQILGVKMKRKGKNKGYSYYPDITFKEETQPEMPHHLSNVQNPNVSPSQKSPSRKLRRGDGEQELSAVVAFPYKACRSRLSFGGHEDVASEDLVSDMSVQLDAMELSSPELSSQFVIMQEELVSVKEKLETLTKKHSNLEQEHTDIQNQLTNLEARLFHYQELASKIITAQDDVISLYKDILDCGNLLGGLLTVSERDAIVSEVKRTREIFNLGMRNQGIQDLSEKFDPMLFSRLTGELKIKCPTIVNILEQFTLSKNVSRNKQTASMKMKASVHLLASLMDVREQRAGNDVPVLFGLLCMYYGAGPSLIEVLQHLGLSESFQVLCGILKTQLLNYKDIIRIRVPDNKPVITYQDNMQLKRTSMRHLRLSKLHEDKDKQDKLWDFTVRGWRAADTDGIEELFENKETAVEPQRDIKTVKYEDTKIECNKDHFEKWCRFKERNLLRKMDLCLNQVHLDKDEIRTGSSELFEEKVSSLIKQPPFFNVCVPGEDIEFPDLSRKKTMVYPLPMSHENQCKIVGTAGNLDLFTEEFGFETIQTKKYLPLSAPKKKFDLDKAYQRFAFTKTLEKHRLQQQKYANILRNQDESDQPLQVVETREATDVVESGEESD